MAKQSFDESKMAMACREALLLMALMPPSYIEKLPKEVHSALMEKQDLSHHPAWEKRKNPRQIAKRNDLLYETVVLMAWLNLEYWEEDETEKARLKAIYDANDKK